MTVIGERIILMFPTVREDVWDNGGREWEGQPRIGRYSSRMCFLDITSV